MWPLAPWGGDRCTGTLEGMTKLRAGLSALLLALLSAWVMVVPAQADTDAPITRYDAQVNLTEKGVAEVTVDFTMDFGVVRGRGPILVFPTRQDDGANPKEQYVFDYSDFRVSSSSGANTQVKKENKSGGVALQIGNKNKWNNGPEDYTVSYKVTGFIVSDHPESNLDEFNWNAIGNAWESRIDNVTVEVTGPDAVQKVACFTGPRYDQKCSASSSGDSATFSATSLGDGNPMQVVAGFEAGTFGGVKQEKALKPSLSNAFSLSPASGVAAGGGVVAALVGLFAIRRRHARDEVYLGLTPGLTPARGEEGNVGTAQGKVNVAVQFNPPGGATPGEIGTLMDTTADDVDVAATIVDLAVRRYLRIESTGKKSFTLHALNRPDGDVLAPYESALLGDLFQGRHVVTSKDLRKQSHQNDLSTARSGLYTAVVGKGWFKSNPNTAQMKPVGLGILAIVVGLGLGVLLSSVGWSLIAIPIVIFGIGLIILSGKFRTRTALGSAFLAQAKGFELYLATAEKDTLRFEEGQDIFSRYLPYAMVFGVAERWSNLFSQLGAEGLYQANTSWYVGTDLMHGYAFASAMNGLTSEMSSAFQAAHAAGMAASTGGSSGGSGFSGGGGFGGGGGGSW